MPLVSALAIAWIVYILVHASILDPIRPWLERIPVFGTAIAIQCAQCTAFWVTLVFVVGQRLEWWDVVELTAWQSAAASFLAGTFVETYTLIVFGGAAILQLGTDDESSDE